MSTRRASPEEVFHRARLIEASGERDAYLRGACGDDLAMHSKVEALLQADAEAGSFLASGSRSPDASGATTPHEQVGATIGRYKLLQKIGEGGFGVVYLAEQRKPMRRKVALKVIKLGMDTRQVIARFEAERQALAMMDHANIAKVLDAGATDSGRPYFVMELVKGIAITDYCDQANLTVQERLDLFGLVCSAVQHAHQKGIIHRDIKPSNVMVTLHDGVPVPKVIDFGIAKATSAELTEKTLFTAHGQMIGTPVYMSPEQAELSGLDIDTRSDIYSLGVLLYELLTGTTPFTMDELREAGFAEMKRLIREQEPPKPSTRLSTLDTLNSIAAHRRIEPRKLPQMMRGDLDWIIMKALEKDRTRRYKTADAFAADISRHLTDEPVLASPPSAAYRVRKFVRRNRRSVIAAGVVLVVLVCGILGTTWGLIRASQERQIADQKTIEAEDNLELARAHEQKANASRDEAEERKQQAEQAAHEARWKSYLASFRSAQVSIQTNDVRTARVLLDQAPTEFRRWEWEYLHAQLDQSLAVLRGHESGVASLAFSPDGSRIASGSYDNTVRLWDGTSGEALGTLTGHKSVVWTVAFSPDGLRIASGSEDKTVRLWDASTGDELHILAGHQSRVKSVAFSPDGSRIVSGAVDKTIRLWDASTGQELLVLRQEAGLGPGEVGISSVAFSPDGSRIVSGLYDKTVRLWDASTGQELRLLHGHEDGVNSVAFSPDGSRIASGSWDKTVRLWDASTGQELRLLRHADTVTSVAFSPDGSRIASGSADKTVRLWDVASGQELRVLLGHEADVSSVAFSPDGSRIASGSDDKTVRLWDASLPDDFAVLRGHTFWVPSAVFSPDGSRIASSGFGDKTARLWDASTGDELAVLRGHQGDVNSVAFSPDGSRIASVSLDRTVRLWDASTGEELLVLGGHEEPVRSVVFSPDGSRIASGSGSYAAGYESKDNTVRLWDASTGEELHVIRGHEDTIFSVVFSPDGSRIASGSADKTVRLWDASTGEELHVLRGHRDIVFSVAFSRDGSRIASGSKDKTVRLWDSASGDELLVLRGHQQDVHSVAFSPDGSRIVSASDDETVRLWDSIAYRDRVAERDDARRAEQIISPRVDELFGKGLDCSTIAAQVRTDATLSEPQRHAALNLVLQRCSTIHEQARSLIDDLEDRLIFVDDIRKAVQSDPALEPRVRAAAVNIARWIEDSPRRLSLVAGRIVDDDDRSQADYERARRAAASALRSNPASWWHARRLAKAWTRLHQPGKAIELWRERIDRLREGIPVDESYLESSLIEYGTALLANDQAADAEPVLRECVSIREKAFKKGHRRTAEARRALGECLKKLARFPEAEALLLEQANDVLENFTGYESRRAQAIQGVVDLYEAWDTAEPGQGYDAKAAEWRARLPHPLDGSSEAEGGDK